MRRYFYSIDRGILQRLLLSRLPEPELQALIGRILDSGVGLYQRPDVVDFLGWDRPLEAGRGLPIGNLTSQWWGNLYLDGLDHHALRTLRVPSYQRYMDDLTIFGDERDRLVDLREAIGAWLSDERHLDLKDPAARPRRCDQPQRYLGYLVSRPGIAPGPRLRGRLGPTVRKHTDRPEHLRSATASVASAWMFG